MMESLRSLLTGACLFAAASSNAIADEILLQTGTRASGSVTRYDAESVDIDVTVGKRTVSRTYPLSKIESLTIDGKVIDLQALRNAGTPDASVSGRRSNRPEKEVLAEIERVGSTPPPWFEATPLEYPDTLDLSWPEKPTGDWDSSKNVGQYIWDRINPNENRWRSGVKLLHHILSTSESPDVQERAMLALGTMYHNLHQDFARAAFWFQKAGVDAAPGKRPPAGLQLASCYWELGSKSMALKTLKAMKSKPYAAIKLMGDLGETDAAVDMAERFSKSGDAAVSLLYAGDACRVAGRFEEAEQFLRRSIAAIPPAEADKPHRQRDRARAEATLEAIRFYTLDPAQIPDGVYTGSSIGYEAEVRIEVEMRSGRIVDVRVIEHREKQFYSSIAETPRKILARQSLKDVDSTTGATITSEAIINATAEALSSGR